MANYRVEAKKIIFDRKTANLKENKDFIYAEMEKIMEKELERRTLQLNLLLRPENILEEDLKNLSVSEENQKTEKEILRDYSFKIEDIEFKAVIVKKMVTSVSFIPKIVEPSFGLTRVFHCVVEQSLKIRGKDEPNCACEIAGKNEETEEKFYLSLQPSICPKKIFISTSKNNLLKEEKIKKILRELENKLEIFEPQIIDRNVSIGKKYVEGDEQGVYLYIVLDDKSLDDGSFTVRCRECTQQKRCSLENILEECQKIFK